MFIKETLKEIKKIKFPSFKELINHTIENIGFILFFMAFFYLCNLLIAFIGKLFV